MIMDKKQKVIFLDFDGVLNNADYRDTVKDYYNNFIDETRMPYLKRIVNETGAVIVLTTTWRLFWNENSTYFLENTQKINRIFEKYGLKVYSKTDFYEEKRNFEISLWLCEHSVENYVILDDIDFGWSEENRRHFVQTDDSREGLDERTTQLAINILNS